MRYGRILMLLFVSLLCAMTVPADKYAPDTGVLESSHSERSSW